jgi:gamma-glutamyltranspeptidase/glutathione hydrolase
MPPPEASDILNISQYVLFTLKIGCGLGCDNHQPSSTLNSISLVTFAILRYCFHYCNPRIMPKMLRLLFFLLPALFAGCQRGTYYVAHKAAIAEAAMVVTPHPLASAVGLKILKQGGNAVDAAIAVQWAMAVVYPRAGNIGGGGFMLIRHADGEAASLDYREKAPALASRDMYLDAQGNVVEGLSISGHLASGVPGAVAGLFEAHARHGKLPMAKLMNPAIELAQKGFSISHGEADRLNAYQADFRKYNEAPNPFFKDQWQAGDLLVQSELARTLQLIRDNGPDGFYKGETAREIVAEMKSANGIISLDDLATYQAKWRKPISGQYKQYRILSMPPPSQRRRSPRTNARHAGALPYRTMGLPFHPNRTYDGGSDAQSLRRSRKTPRR